MNVTENEIMDLLKQAGVGADLSAVANDTPLRTAGVDSLDMMNVLLAIEEKYSIKISDNDAASLESVNSIIEYLRGR